MKILFTFSLFLLVLLLPARINAQLDCDCSDYGPNTFRTPLNDLHTFLAIDEFMYQPGDNINVCVAATNIGSSPIELSWDVTLYIRQANEIKGTYQPWTVYNVTLENQWDCVSHNHVLIGATSLPYGGYEMRAVFADYSDYYMFVLFTINPPVPVELSSFSAKANGQTVVLNWETQTEVNNYGFELERSVDEENYHLIIFISGNGNSNSPKFYSYTDSQLTGGNTFYYRLKQIDNDGTYEYVAEASISLDIKDFYLAQNYPNPFNPNTKIVFNLPSTGHISLKVYNILGVEVANLVDGELLSGRHIAEFNATDFPSGVYFYILNAGENRATKKMTLTK